MESFRVTVKIAVSLENVEAKTAVEAEELSLQLIRDKLDSKTISVNRLSALARKEGVMEISNCQCGRKALTDESDATVGYWVQCQEVNCWIGPTKQTAKEAIKTWNKIMERKSK